MFLFLATSHISACLKNSYTYYQLSNWDSAQQNAEQFEEYWDETSHSLYLDKRVYTLYEYFLPFLAIYSDRYHRKS